MKPNSWIPNEVGFKLTVVLHDGSRHQTEVILKDFGKAGMLHALKDFKISQIKGWL